MVQESLDRRSMLKGIAVSGAALSPMLAGCLGDDDDGGSTPTPTPTETPSPSPTPTPTEALIETSTHDAYGELLVDADGRTLYMFEPDAQGDSVCYDDCAAAWPPLTVAAEGDLEADGAVSADLETIERDDGTLQVTADGWPLYYFVQDTEPGQVNGQGVVNRWWVLRPDGTVVESTVSMTEHDDLGPLLTDSAGQTLYRFEADDGGESVCYDDCAAAWPPLTVESEAALIGSATTSAELGTSERNDGSLQVTANGWPLYYFVQDDESGDALGQEFLNIWFVLRPDGDALKPTVSAREHDDHGEILTDADGMTLYIFENDDQGESTCYGECEAAWPPLTVESEDDLTASVRASVDLGTTERDDGSLQVTADDWPLYYFVQDDEPGEATGQGVNDIWWVLTPDGTIVQ